MWLEMRLVLFEHSRENNRRRAHHTAPDRMRFRHHVNYDSYHPTIRRSRNGGSFTRNGGSFTRSSWTSATQNALQDVTPAFQGVLDDDQR